MPLIRVDEETHGWLVDEAKRQGLTMSKLVSRIVLAENNDPYNEECESVVKELIDTSEVKRLAASSEGVRDHKSSVACTWLTSALLDVLVQTVPSSKVRDKQTYLEWLALKEYRAWKDG